MIEVYARYKAPVIALEEVAMSEVQRYGVIEGTRQGNLVHITSLVEKPKPAEAPSNLAVLGRYILTPDLFEILQRQKPGAGGEIQLTDALKKLAKKRPIYGYTIRKGVRYDGGDKLGYLEATVDFALKNTELSEEFRKFLIEKVKKFL
jgi:UTP--glucose-1-phosphate uridylyltransferase